MKEHKAVSLIGLAMKAGKVAAGEFAAEKALREGRAQLLVLAEDASKNTLKKFSNMAAWREIPTCRFLNKEELGRAIGKEERSSLVITDAGLAKKVREEIEKQ